MLFQKTENLYAKLNIEQIVVLFERSRDHLALLEVKLTTEESVEFNDNVEAYIEFSDDLDQLLDDLSIELLRSSGTSQSKFS